MKIKVAIKNDESEKERGDILEKLACELLKRQNYSVEEQVRLTGTEVDLLCRGVANNAKELYVECKAHKGKVQADVIAKLCGIASIKKCKESWLITTSELGKEAKGAVPQLSSAKDESSFFVHRKRPML